MNADPTPMPAPVRAPAIAPQDGRGVRACVFPGSNNVALIIETSSGACPIVCILDEEWFPPHKVVEVMATLEKWLNDNDPVAPPVPPLELLRAD